MHVLKMFLCQSISCPVKRPRIQNQHPKSIKNSALEKATHAVKHLLVTTLDNKAVRAQDAAEPVGIELHKDHNNRRLEGLLKAQHVKTELPYKSTDKEILPRHVNTSRES